MVIENRTIQKLWYGFLFTFHGNCGRIFRRFSTIHERESQTDRHRTTAKAALMHGVTQQKPMPCLSPRGKQLITNFCNSQHFSQSFFFVIIVYVSGAVSNN